MTSPDVASVQLLQLEYEKASEFCVHVDDVRNIITSFFLTLVAGTGVVLSRYSEGSLRSILGLSGEALLFVSLSSVSVIGLLFVITLSRLRRVQLERYRTMNAILDEVLLPEHRSVVPFVNSRIADGRSPGAIRGRSTGSYSWTLTIILPTGTLAGLATMSGLSATSMPLVLQRVFSLMIGAGIVWLTDKLYWRLSR